MVNLLWANTYISWYVMHDFLFSSIITTNNSEDIEVL